MFYFHAIKEEVSFNSALTWTRVSQFYVIGIKQLIKLCKFCPKYAKMVFSIFIPTCPLLLLGDLCLSLYSGLYIIKHTSRGFHLNAKYAFQDPINLSCIIKQYHQPQSSASRQSSLILYNIHISEQTLNLTCCQTSDLPPYMIKMFM